MAEENIYSLKPITCAITDLMSDVGGQDPISLPKIHRILGYVVALEGFSIYLEDEPKRLVSSIIESVEHIDNEYNSCRKPDKFEVPGSSVNEIFESVQALDQMGLSVKQDQFIHIFASTLKYIEEKVHKGSTTIDEVYSLYGILSAFDLFDYCHSIAVYASLVNNMEIYAGSWPAKFALDEVKQDLQHLLLEYRTLAA